MNAPFRFKVLTIMVFCVYVFWGSFGVDLTLNPDGNRIALHRVFILFTFFIFLFNVQNVVAACLKNKLLIVLIFYVLLSATWAFNPAATLKNFIFISSCMLISIMTALAFYDNKIILIRWLFWLFLIMLQASIIAALYFPQLGVNAKDFVNPRWIGITAHPNGLGAQALGLIWLASNLFFLSKSKIEKSIIIFGLITAFYAIIKADSMTSLITSLIVTGFTCYYYLFERLSLPVKIILFTVSLLSFLYVITFYMSTSELASSTIESTGRDTTFTGRAVLWENGLKSTADNLILGNGFDDLEQLTRKYHTEMSHLHNGYIETFVKGGFVACLLLASILIKTFIHQLKVKSTSKKDFIFLNTGLVMVLVHNFTESSILRGLNTLSIFIIFIIVSTSLISVNYKNNIV